MPTTSLRPATVATEDAQRLRQAVARLNRRLRVSSAGGLTPSQLSCLSTVVRHGPLRVGELAVREALNPTSLSRILGRLEDLGYLSRTPVPTDRRGAVLTPTGAGRRVLTRLEEERTALLRERLSGLVPAQLAAIRAAVPALEALVEALPAPGLAR